MGAFSDIANRVLAPAATKVEHTLANLLTLALDWFMRLMHLGGVPEQVKARLRAVPEVRCFEQPALKPGACVALPAHRIAKPERLLAIDWLCVSCTWAASQSLLPSKEDQLLPGYLGGSFFCTDTAVNQQAFFSITG